jgi:UDP-2-acetamido-3-amino-2,3-dideoxy-glucuronate N-acetyltransferase
MTLDELKPINIIVHIDGNGNLIAIDDKFIEFPVKRIFCVTKVKQAEVRGKHAHYQTQQFLVCLQGLILVSLFDGTDIKHVVLKPNTGIFVPPMIWDEETYLTDDDILVSLCSTYYDKNDYIENKEEFIKLIQKQKEK